MAVKKGMSREQSIKELSDLKSDIFPYLHRDYNIALDMAIKALGEEKSVGIEMLKELDDLIHPVTSGNYVDFDKPRKDLWSAFRKKWSV